LGTSGGPGDGTSGRGPSAADGRGEIFAGIVGIESVTSGTKRTNVGYVAGITTLERAIRDTGTTFQVIVGSADSAGGGIRTGITVVGASTTTVVVEIISRVAGLADIWSITRITAGDITIQDTGIVFQMIASGADGTRVVIGTGIAIRRTILTSAIIGVIPGVTVAIAAIVGAGTRVTTRDITIQDTGIIFQMIASGARSAGVGVGTSVTIRRTILTSAIIGVISSVAVAIAAIVGTGAGITAGDITIQDTGIVFQMIASGARSASVGVGTGVTIGRTVAAGTGRKIVASSTGITIVGTGASITAGDITI
jgi:hypothetical protein